MSHQPDETRSQTFTVQLELIPEDPHNPDPATVGEVAREVVDTLRNNGYTVQPAYTGERGGTLFDIAQQIARDIYDHKDLLILLFGAAKPVAECLKDRLTRRAEQETARTRVPSQPIKITIVVDGTPMTIEVPDIEDAAKLAERFQITHPAVAANATTKSKVRVIGTVSPKAPRRRR